MTKLINAEELKKALEPTCDYCDKEKSILHVSRVKAIIDNMPNANMTAKWKTVSVDENNRPWLWACENCGEETDHKWDFCPVCGCEMTNPWKPKKK